MLRHALCCCLSLGLLSGAAAPLVRASDAEVAKGIQQVDDGEYDAAILTLDSASRRLAAAHGQASDLSEAYLYLGIAYLGKGHETAAKARFREAITQVKDLRLSPDKFAPRVIDLFEKARAESEKPAVAEASPTPPPPATKKKGGKLGLILLGVGGAAAGGVALAAHGGGGSSAAPAAGLTTSSFPNETVVFGGGRDFQITVNGSGTLTATVTWSQTGVVLGMYLVNLANPSEVIVNAGQTGSMEARLQSPVNAGSYRVAVTNSTGQGPQVTTTFTLTVVHP